MKRFIFHLFKYIVFVSILLFSTGKVPAQTVNSEESCRYYVDKSGKIDLNPGQGWIFSVTNVRFDDNFSDTQEMTLSVENSGTEVMLTDCFIKLALLDCNDAVVSSFTTNWDAKIIKVSETVDFNEKVIFENAPLGIYKLAIGLFRNESDPKPTYNLDNAVRTEDGFFVIGTIEIGKQTIVTTPVITITTQPAVTTNVTAGGITGNLSVAANVTQGAKLSYQWYSATTKNNTEGTEISNTTNATFSIPPTLTASGSPYYYFCEVRAMGGASSVRSNIATVNVSAPIPVITITSQPAVTTNVTEGDITDNLSVAANVTQDATLSYQWYSATTNDNTEGTEISDATNATFAIPPTLTASGSPYYYFCEVRATGGASSVRSNVATIKVIGIQTLTAANLFYTTADNNVDLSGHATSSAGANGGAITYLVTDAGTTEAKIEGSVLSFNSMGVATITATTTGNDNYDGATTTFMVTVTNEPVSSIEIPFVQNLKVYPNPFIDELYIEGANGSALRVIDSKGATEHIQRIVNSDEIVRLKRLPANVYFFRFEKERITHTIKVIKN